MHSDAFLQQPQIQEALISATLLRVFRLILISFTFDLCVAYEAAKASRNPFTVYIAVLNQQLCKTETRWQTQPKIKHKSDSGTPPEPQSVTKTMQLCQKWAVKCMMAVARVSVDGARRSPY